MVDWATSQDILQQIAKHIVSPVDLVRFSRVSRSWREAVASNPGLWSARIAHTYGRVAQQRPGSSSGPMQHFQTLCTLHGVDAWSGWCEDNVTSHGAAYTMYLHDVEPQQPTPSCCHQRTYEALSRWAYTQPLPRTRLRIVCCSTMDKEVWGKDGLVQVACTRSGGVSVPLYSRRVKMVEYQRLPGSGPVDVPVHYYAFQVGPALLGCFMPHQAPLALLQLRRHDQKLGTFILWPAALLQGNTVPGAQGSTNNPPNPDPPPQGAAMSGGSGTPATGGLAQPGAQEHEGGSAFMSQPCTSSCPCAGTPHCMLHCAQQRQAKAGGAGVADTTSAVTPPPFLTPASWTRLDAGASSSGSGSSSAAAPAGGCCDWLRWQGLAPGSQLSGTVLTNFLVTSVNTGLRCGHAMLGPIKVWVTHAAPAPPAAPQGPALRVQLLLHLPAREWMIDAAGVPAAAEPHESAYTAAITCTAAVDVTPDGKLWPLPLPPLRRPPQPPEPNEAWAVPVLPQPAAGNGVSHSPMWNSSVPFVHGQFDGPEAMPAPATAQAAGQAPAGAQAGGAGAGPTAAGGGVAEEGLPDLGGLELNATHTHMQTVLAAALQLSNSPGAAHPALVDRWPARLQGQVSGGVMTCMITHPVVGRAVMCVAEGGCEALCPRWN